MKKESPHITSGMTIMPPIVGTTHTAGPLYDIFELQRSKKRLTTQRCLIIAQVTHGVLIAGVIAAHCAVC